jgi:hypothetical protein
MTCRAGSRPGNPYGGRPTPPGSALHAGPGRIRLSRRRSRRAALDLAGSEPIFRTVRLRLGRPGFAEEALRASAYQCPMCGFDGALWHYPSRSKQPTSAGTASMAPTGSRTPWPCTPLHHTLFDPGVLAVTEDRRIRVPGLYSSVYQENREAGVIIVDGGLHEPAISTATSERANGRHNVSGLWQSLAVDVHR